MRKDLIYACAAVLIFLAGHVVLVTVSDQGTFWTVAILAATCLSLIFGVLAFQKLVTRTQELKSTLKQNNMKLATAEFKLQEIDELVKRFDILTTQQEDIVRQQTKLFDLVLNQQEGGPETKRKIKK